MPSPGSATVRPDGAPHVVPVVLALVDGTVHSAVDAEPKRTRRLQRPADVRADPRCALLVDHHGDDRSRLWWVRADGTATVVEDLPAAHPGPAALVARHPQYRAQPPDGPLPVVTVERWSGGSSTS